MNVKRVIFSLLAGAMKGGARVMSHLPLFGGFGKRMYASMLFEEANGLYFQGNYTGAEIAFKKAFEYAGGMDNEPPIGWCIQEAYKVLGGMYENGLGVEKDDLKAEECYLRAGSRGNEHCEHAVATKSWYAQH